jgi:hypothetical protein
MNFYTRQHKHYCGIDLHAKAMYICILDQAGTIVVHKNLPTTSEAFLRHCQLICSDAIPGRARGGFLSSFLQAAKAGVVLSCQM